VKRYVAEKASADAKVVELLSPLPIEECHLLLEAAMDTLWPWDYFGSRLVAGRISGSKLFARKQVGYKNLFQTRLSADTLEQDGRTLIRCRFSLHPFTRTFQVLWFAGVLLICGPIFVMSLLTLAEAPSRGPAGKWEGVFVPIGMFVFSVGNYWFGRYLARNERQFLIAFVCDTLAATPLQA
jgi:hypothetical protein